jgi:hypothetical protein
MIIIGNPELEAQRYQSARLNSCDNNKFLQKVTGCDQIAYRSWEEVYTPYGGHNLGASILLNTGLNCYAEHNNFTLTPDSIWSLIGDTIAKAVTMFPDRYAHLLMHGSWNGTKTEILVQNDSQTLNGEWANSIELFRNKMLDLVPDQTFATLTPEFSTSGYMENLSKLLTLMDAGSSYYTYVVSTRCGIPQIRLEGTQEDWMKIHNLLDWVATNIEDLKLYALYLQSHVLKIASTVATNQIDYQFWGDCIKYNNTQGSGSGPKINGWLATFSGYTTTSDKNNLKDYSDPARIYELRCDTIASCTPVVDFIWDCYGNQIPMKFIGGIIGTDDKNGFNTPVFGYATAVV